MVIGDIAITLLIVFLLGLIVLVVVSCVALVRYTFRPKPNEKLYLLKVGANGKLKIKRYNQDHVTYWQEYTK